MGADLLVCAAWLQVRMAIALAFSSIHSIFYSENNCLILTSVLSILKLMILVFTITSPNNGTLPYRFLYKNLTASAGFLVPAIVGARTLYQ
jgi:hypothetical protein